MSTIVKIDKQIQNHPKMLRLSKNVKIIKKCKNCKKCQNCHTNLKKKWHIIFSVVLHRLLALDCLPCTLIDCQFVIAPYHLTCSFVSSTTAVWGSIGEGKINLASHEYFHSDPHQHWYIRGRFVFTSTVTAT